MKKVLMSVILCLLINSNVFAQNDVSIDTNGNVTTGTSASGNLEVTGASGEKAIYGIGFDTGGAGVYGENTTLSNTNYGLLGHPSYGVYGQSASGYGVYGVSTNSIGVFGYSQNNFAVYGNSNTGWAGYFNGNVMVIGNLTVGGTLIGYSETDPVFSAWDRSSGISIVESQIEDLNHFTNVNEADPVFSTWDKSTGISIMESQVTDLDKYSQAEVDTIIAALDARITALENQKHWSVPIQLETGVSETQIGVDESGNAIAVWARGGVIYAMTYITGTGWGAAVTIESGTGNSSTPQISVNGSGSAFAVWTQNNTIYSNRYVVGTGWDTVTPIEDTPPSFSVSNPQVSIDESGNAIAVWQFAGFTKNIYANRYVVGTGWGTETQIESGAGDASTPQIAVDGSGNAIAVWQQYDGTYDSIYANRYIVGTGWGIETQIESGVLWDASTPQIAVDGSGNAIAVWKQNSIYANRYVAGTGWGTEVEVGSGTAHNPQISVNESGSAIAVWSESSHIYANHYVVGTGWGTALQIDSGAGGAFTPQIGVDGSGNAFAVWKQNDGTDNSIYASRFVTSTGWGLAAPIESGTGGASTPQIGVDGNGNAIAVWIQNNNIYANHYW